MNKKYFLLFLSSLTASFSLFGMQDLRNPLDDIDTISTISSEESESQNQILAGLMASIKEGSFNKVEELLKTIEQDHELTWLELYNQCSMSNEPNALNPFEFAVHQVASIQIHFDKIRFEIALQLLTALPNNIQTDLKKTSRAPHIAAQCNNGKIVWELNQLGFAMDNYDICGYTPLHYAAQKRHQLLQKNDLCNAMAILIKHCRVDTTKRSNNEENITYEEIIQRNIASKQKLVSNQNGCNCCTIA